MRPSRSCSDSRIPAAAVSQRARSASGVWRYSAIGGFGAGELLLDLRGSERFEDAQGFAGGGIDGSDHDQ